MEMHNHHNFEILLTSVWILYHLTCINYYIEFLNTQTKGKHCGAYNFYCALCRDSIPGGELISCCLKPVPITEVQSKIGKAHKRGNLFPSKDCTTLSTMCWVHIVSQKWGYKAARPDFRAGWDERWGDSATLMSPDSPGILRTLLCACSCSAGTMCWALQSLVVVSDWISPRISWEGREMMIFKISQLG